MISQIGFGNHPCVWLTESISPYRDLSVQRSLLDVKSGWKIKSTCIVHEINAGRATSIGLKDSIRKRTSFVVLNEIHFALKERSGRPENEVPICRSEGS
ncbi:hypothetical protein AVEN_112588-1 [Araneus ventricosus]|uniref:Uncharacterized protein n=1 Tax=Araneus ventricosus TaxID=182803 RepID=A0A4Y2L3C5_ARAVE|nr:hypothetical protein AVEN_112588-1 [Araneus ventricosus]